MTIRKSKEVEDDLTRHEFLYKETDKEIEADGITEKLKNRMVTHNTMISYYKLELEYALKIEELEGE